MIPKPIPKPKKKKKDNRTATKTLDTLWSKATKKLAGNKCEVCGKVDTLNSHHVIGRSNYALRWEIKNSVVLCANHHKFSREFSAHNNPVWFDGWLRDNKPEQYEFLQKPESRSIKKWTEEARLEKYNELKAILEE